MLSSIPHFLLLLAPTPPRSVGPSSPGGGPEMSVVTLREPSVSRARGAPGGGAGAGLREPGLLTQPGTPLPQGARSQSGWSLPGRITRATGPKPPASG